MSFLRLNEQPEETKLPEEPAVSGGSGMVLRYATLAGLGLCIFGISVALLLRVVPPPLRELDYFMIGTVSVMAAVLLVFLVGAKTSFWKT